MKTPARLLILLTLLPVISVGFSFPTLGQELRSGQIASNTEIDDLEAKAADILTKSGDEIVRATTAYGPNLFGGVVENPSVILNKESATTLPVISYGEVLVRV